eukprot:c23438_g1_i1.p2 GENE.c23438_g1_i1~~c23438_g1_i1.p2  ORF type:complete len:108 (+),score=12.49 c23438_g1_i1:185-508(+)
MHTLRQRQHHITEQTKKKKCKIMYQYPLAALTRRGTRRDRNEAGSHGENRSGGKQPKKKAKGRKGHNHKIKRYEDVGTKEAPDFKAHMRAGGGSQWIARRSASLSDS